MALTATHLVSFHSATSSSTAVTGSYTPTANRLILAAVFSADSDGAAPTPTGSGNSLTWVQIDTQSYFSGVARLTWFRAMGASPTTGAFTATYGDSQDLGRTIIIIEIAGVDTSGTNGSGAIVQSDINTGSGTSLSAALAAFGSANNGVVAFWGGSQLTATLSPEGGYTEVREQNGVMVSFLASNDTTPTATQSVNDEWAAIAIEVKAAATAHELTANELTMTPVLDDPALGQIHGLTVDELTMTAVLDAPALSQVHVITPDEITMTPVLDVPSLGQVHNLTADELTVTAVLDTPTLGQVHALTANELTMTPILDTPSLDGTISLTADELTMTPVLDAPDLTQVHNLTADELDMTAVLDVPALTQIHGLTANELILTPILDTPTLTQIHGLTAVELLMTAVLGTPAIVSGMVGHHADTAAARSFSDTAASRPFSDTAPLRSLTDEAGVRAFTDTAKTRSFTDEATT